MGWCRIALVIAGKDVYREYMGKMVFLIVNACNCAYRGMCTIVAHCVLFVCSFVCFLIPDMRDFGLFNGSRNNGCTAAG